MTCGQDFAAWLSVLRNHSSQGETHYVMLKSVPSQKLVLKRELQYGQTLPLPPVTRQDFILGGRGRGAEECWEKQKADNTESQSQFGPSY